MKRPVWLFSMDTEQFASPPMTTGALKAFFVSRGRTAERTDVELVHFLQPEEIEPWLTEQWAERCLPRARQAVERGLRPVVGFSVYTWNAAEFLHMVARLRASCRELLIVAGGPHVQQAETYLEEDDIDVVVLGEGEATFQQLLDCDHPRQWASVAGLAYLDDAGRVHKTPPRPRCTRLDDLPTALDVIELRDGSGHAKYERVAYETSRGCPFRCAFCEWGTGAIGTKMHQFSLPRIRRDLERLIDGGVQDVWLCDSNFGALREDLDKAKLVVELRQRTGRPSTFATSWSKSHNARVQEIVLLLQRNGLLQNYNLALQTLTPLALKLSNRKNMRSNQYEPIAKSMAAEGVPIATELIWGLPGDNLRDFESNLDRLAAVFPNINIFGYTLLPGTEFYERRHEYDIEAIPVAGYGKAKGEYVVGCHTFGREEGIEGYFLITAHIMLIRGCIMPLTARLLSLDGSVPVSALLRTVLRELIAEFGAGLPHLDLDDKMVVYETRDQLYLAMLQRAVDCFAVVRRVVERWLVQCQASAELARRARCTLALDEARCPRVGPGGVFELELDFDARAVDFHLERMETPPAPAFARQTCCVRVHHKGHVGEVLQDPDGGSWMRGTLVEETNMPAASAPLPLPAPA